MLQCLRSLTLLSIAGLAGLPCVLGAAAPLPKGLAVAEPRVIVPTSQKSAQVWRYKTKWPGKTWFKPDFDDKEWQQGPGGFGVKGTPGAVVRTEWNTRIIWLRRSFELPKHPGDDVRLLVHHDEDANIYLNGVLAATLRGYVTNYIEVPIRPEALAALRPGQNVIAIYCRQTTGGQYIDAGLVRATPPR